MPYIKVNDITLFYEIQGKGHPLILLTGFNADHKIWLNVIEEYAKHFQVIAIDNRGAGQSDAPDYPYSIDMMADDVAALCKSLHINAAHFIGASMGGAILQTLAYKYPQMILSAVIENSFTQIDIRFALFAEARQELMKAGAPTVSLIKSVIPWCFSSQFLKKLDFVDSFIERALANPFPPTLMGHQHQLNALVKFDSSSWVNKIQSPCLVIGSDQDMIVSETHMQQMTKQIPQAKYYGFKECGHLPHIEQTDTFNRIVLDFLMTEDNRRN